MKRITLTLLAIVLCAGSAVAQIGRIWESPQGGKFRPPRPNKFILEIAGFQTPTDDDRPAIIAILIGLQNQGMVGASQGFAPGDHASANQGEDRIVVYDPADSSEIWSLPLSTLTGGQPADSISINIVGFVRFRGQGSTQTRSQMPFSKHAIVSYDWDINNDGTFDFMEKFLSIVDPNTNEVVFTEQGALLLGILQRADRRITLLEVLVATKQFAVVGETGGNSGSFSSAAAPVSALARQTVADYQLDLKFQAEPGLRLAYDPELFDPPGDNDLDGDGRSDIAMLVEDANDEPQGVIVRNGQSYDILWQFQFPTEHKTNILKGSHGFADANGDGEKEVIVGDNLAVTLDGTVHTIAENFQTLDVNDLDNDGFEDIIGLNTIDSSAVVYGILNPTSVADYDPAEIHFRLFQNYPNPFNPSTTISYSVVQAGDVELTIFNALGQAVRRLVNERKSAGEYSLSWDGRDDAGRQLSSGSYFYRLKVGEAVQTRRMLFLK
ncbi:T9SS type A sorting domain-containing protein [Cytophagia bacterium CHB2]|nr:T9SS type A sorting domain-containing protein [Cytophagia bacterium CHB2]